MTATNTADVGLVGLAVMGQNLALNMADHGFNVAVYNRTTRVTREFINQYSDTPGRLMGYETLDNLGPGRQTATPHCHSGQGGDTGGRRHPAAN